MGRGGGLLLPQPTSYYAYTAGTVLEYHHILIPPTELCHTRRRKEWRRCFVSFRCAALEGPVLHRCDHLARVGARTRLRDVYNIYKSKQTTLDVKKQAFFVALTFVHSTTTRCHDPENEKISSEKEVFLGSKFSLGAGHLIVTWLITNIKIGRKSSAPSTCARYQSEYAQHERITRL